MSWYDNKETGKDGISVSTRIRLARNIKGIPFPSKMSDAQREEVNTAVKNAVSKSDLPVAKGLKFIKMEDIPENERYCMVERHIISPEFAASPKGRAVVISEDETVSIMIGEEDHIRIQVVLGGLVLDKAYEIADLVDDMLCRELCIAYDKRLGFLTECPTNLGTGMRASVMLHLPFLNETGELKRFSDSASKIGYTVRGMYGEGSRSAVSLFQISNQITLGLGEKDAINNLKVIADNLITREEELRKSIDKEKLCDVSMRALGTLKYARIMSSNEMMQLISNLCVGISSGTAESKIPPFKLFVEGQPHMLMRKYGELSPEERDIKRAEMIRESLE